MAKKYVRAKVPTELKEKLAEIAYRENRTLDEIVSLFLSEGVTTYQPSTAPSNGTSPARAGRVASAARARA